MFAYDKTFDPKVVIGHYDLISRFSDFPLYLGTQLVYFFHDMFAYDKTFDRKVLLLILGRSGFGLKMGKFC